MLADIGVGYIKKLGVFAKMLNWERIGRGLRCWLGTLGRLLGLRISINAVQIEGDYSSNFSLRCDG